MSGPDALNTIDNHTSEQELFIGVQKLTGDQAEIPTLLANGVIEGMKITDGKLLVRKEPACMFQCDGHKVRRGVVIGYLPDVICSPASLGKIWRRRASGRG